MDLPLLMLPPLWVAVKRQRTIQLSVVAVLLLPVVQCYTFTTRLLPKMRVVSDIIFSGLISNVNVDFYEALGPNWIFDLAVSNYLGRLKIIIQDTRSTQYLKGDYEGKEGRVLAASENPVAYEQTARVRFDTGEERSIVARYIRPQRPTYTGEQILVLDGKHRGKVMVVREKPDTGDVQIVASSIANSEVDPVPAYASVALFDDDPGMGLS